MLKTVTITNDIFVKMLWDRVEDFYASKTYPESFWKAAFDYLGAAGWMSQPNFNDPYYIVDNIAVNSEIVHKDEVRTNFDWTNGLTDEEVQKGIESRGWIRIDDYWVINWNL